MHHAIKSNPLGINQYHRQTNPRQHGDVVNTPFGEGTVDGVHEGAAGRVYHVSYQDGSVGIHEEHELKKTGKRDGPHIAYAGALRLGFS